MISKIRGEVTSRIGKVIFNFNLIESTLNFIIISHFKIDKNKEDFFRDVMLNSSIISFNAKVKILRQILEIINFNESKKLLKNIEDLNRYRNMIAHCTIKFEKVSPDSPETENNLNHQIYLDVSYIKPSLKNSMNAQGKVNDREFFELYEKFKKKTSEIEKQLFEVYKYLE